MPAQPLLDDPFLHAQWSAEFEAFQNGPESAALLARLRAWAARDPLTERASEAAFIQRFFVETWGYRLQGDHTPDYTCRPQFEVGGAGQAGGTGFADLALGRFGTGGDGIPQVLGEFKDIRSGLDAKQARKGNTRSPVEQCFDYLHAAWQSRDRDGLVEPFFALVTDMNEFRLYARRLGRGQFQRFVLSGAGRVTEPCLLADTPAAVFRRFVFWRLLRPDMLLAERGAPPLDRLLRDQIVREKAIEKAQESVEITKLALWLHTAAPGKPLCALDANIRCGNSLVGPDFSDFYRQRHQTLFAQIDENERERINAFDWHAAFPEVFSHGGFDCVIGNPPYIKLQHFRRAQEDVAAYLVEARHPDGSPLYASTQSGNFDMYLPFIEKGVRLLRPEGRMGYIAPNVWMVNEYGKPLRQLVRQARSLDRWLDFKSHQIFDEAITYTALQFFRGSPADALTCAFAPDGNAAAVDWRKADRVPYGELPEEEAWTLAPKAEMELIARLGGSCKMLEQCAKGIIVGIQTSADEIYHLKRLGPNKYETRKGLEVAIEDALMHPLVSGPEAKRYLSPRTETYLLFPYTVEGLGKVRLIPANQMQSIYPLSWAYLLSRESDLRQRENSSFDDDGWYRFGRNQNIDKQELPKLIVAQTVPSLRVCNDSEAAFHLNNVRVNGILTADPEDGWYLLGILNAPICDFVFRRTAKAKEGGYYEANKQFIAPLPIPDATPEERMEVGRRARELQNLHTLRRDTIAKLDQRLNCPQTAPVSPAPKEDWLWAEVGTPASWKRSPAAPAGLPARDLTAWAKQRHADVLQQRLDALDALLQPGAALAVTNSDDELALHLAGREALRLYDKPDTPFLAAQWRHALRGLNITESFNAPRLLKHLLTLRTTPEPTLRNRILALDHEITTLDQTIAGREAALNAIIYQLYRLTPGEIGMVESG